MTTYIGNMIKLGGDEVLTEDEKKTLGMVLREKIVETHDVDNVLQVQLLGDNLTEIRKIVLTKALQDVRSIRDDCYSIAMKLSIK